jgi:hypothetical protein
MLSGRAVLFFSSAGGAGSLVIHGSLEELPRFWQAHLEDNSLPKNRVPSPYETRRLPFRRMLTYVELHDWKRK